ncbi:hypothetical protein HJ581_0044785 [Rhodococcus opacus]|nr:hypothetical protein HJ581_0044785 [Rhodococcus opacus]
MIDDVTALIHATRTSLNTVVMSAVDKSDPMAVEQIQLAVANLDFVCSRLDTNHARVRFTLAETERMSAAVAERLSKHGADQYRLPELCRVALTELQRADSSVQAMRAANAELTARLRVLIRDYRERDDQIASDIRDVVVDRSESLVRSERAWFAPFGFDPGAEALPSPEEIYGQVKAQ